MDFFKLLTRPRTTALRLSLTVAVGAWLATGGAAAGAQLAPNQTNGFGNGRLVTFTYLQNFDCVDQPMMDLNFDGIEAQSDPGEMQTPICQVVTEPAQDPTGGDLELIALFGHIPEAWRSKPSVATQCPDPNNPIPGTCTMHASSVDLSVLLAGSPGLAKPPTGPVFLPTPNHSHVVDNSRVNTTPIWWEVRPVLINDPKDWPTPDGRSGITSSRAMDAAEAAGRAVEVGSNFFLFFSSKLSTLRMPAMPGM